MHTVVCLMGMKVTEAAEGVLRSAGSLVGSDTHWPETCEVKEERDTYNLVSKAVWVGAEVGREPCWQ